MKKALLILVFAVMACQPRWHETVPAAPDYDRGDSWYMSVGDLDADVFYILPTCVFDRRDSVARTVCHYMDPADEEQRSAVTYSQMVAEEMFGDCNLYIPYYRQVSMETFLEGKEAERFPTAMDDLQRAFDHWQDRLNSGRPFILAGFSQGGKGVVELLKRLTPSQAERLVAAYVIGYKVTAQDLENGNILPAQDSVDTGVTVCWNSVRTPADAWPSVSEGNLLCINPVNWSTGSEPAILSEGITVAVDTVSHLLLVDGFAGSPIRIAALDGIITEGNYHLADPELYKAQVRRNVAARVHAKKPLVD